MLLRTLQCNAHVAVNLLDREKTSKHGVKNKQFRAAMDNEYLTKVLAA